MKFTGGREGEIYCDPHDSQLIWKISVTGILKGYDQLLNLVLDEVTEEIQGVFNNSRCKF